MMTTGFDVRRWQGGSSLLHGVRDAAVQAIGDEAIALLVEHREAGSVDVPSLEHPLWERVRGQVIDARGTTVEAALVGAGHSAPTLELRRVLQFLLSAGNLERTLRRQHALIGHQLAELEPVRRVGEEVRA